MKKLITAFSIVLLSSCASKVPPQSVRVYDQNAYTIAKPLLNRDFVKQKIDTEIFPSASIINPLEGVSGYWMAKNLYKKLSLSFRFQNAGSGAQVIFLKDYVSDNAQIIMHAYGFTINQGAELITATLLGETDWDNDGVNDYLASFRINQKALQYESNKQQARVELPTREYILLIKDVNSDVYEAQILFIHDYIKQSSGIRSEVYKDHKAAKNSLFQDHGAVSFEQGQEQIVFAPSAGDNQRKKFGSKNEQVNKTELSE